MSAAAGAPIAVITPHFQRMPGLLARALASAFEQTVGSRVLPIVCDDGSPVPARDEIASLPAAWRARVVLVEQTNAGAGAARNRALDSVPEGTRLVAFLDSDDTWRADHLANAEAALAAGHDAYFADWCSFNFPGTTNFTRIGALDAQAHAPVPDAPHARELGVSPLEHIVRDGGGVIQTSTVVYRHDRHPTLRFREEFYNGQDFFFWMDLGERGARFVFSTSVDADNGEGVNIYQGAGWGTERSLQRLRNELFVWTSVRRFYRLTDGQRASNRRTIRNLQAGVVRDVLHRLRRRQPVRLALLRDIVGMDPSILALAPWVPMRVLLDRGRAALARAAGNHGARP
jgi:succinoglycan biosynthesis protein ExoW